MDGKSGRERKEPAWLRSAGYAVLEDGRKWRREAGDDEFKGLRAPKRKRRDPNVPRVVSQTYIDDAQMQVTVELMGRRFSGVVQQTAPSSNTGRVAEDYEPKEGQLCALCGLALTKSVGKHEGVDEEGKLVRVNTQPTVESFCHLDCALWCPDVFEDRSRGLVNLANAIRRGRQLRCRICSRKGATLGCCYPTCSSVHHLPCAIMGKCQLDVPYGAVWCPQHKQHK